MDFYNLNLFQSIGKYLENRQYKSYTSHRQYKCYTSLELKISIRLNKRIVLKFHLHHLSVLVALSDHFNGSDSASSPKI